MNNGIDLNDLPGAHGGRERAHGKPVRKEARAPQYDGLNHARWQQGQQRDVGDWYELPPNRKDTIVNYLAVFLGVLALLVGLAYVGFAVYEYIIEPVFSFIFEALETLVNAVLEAVQFVVDVVSAIVEAIEFVLDGIVAIVSFIFEVIYVLFWGLIGFILLPFWLLYEVGSYIMEVVDWFLSGLAWLFGA